MFQIGGGVALILFGVRSLRKSLDRLFGANLAAWLQSATRTRWRAFGGGCAIARLAPASTTVALLSLDVMRTGRVPPERTLAVMLGANVGITFNVHLLSFDISSYSAVFLVLGLVGFQILTRNLFRGVG
jgi:phosphate:Na+ symporter